MKSWVWRKMSTNKLTYWANWKCKAKADISPKMNKYAKWSRIEFLWLKCERACIKHTFFSLERMWISISVMYQYSIPIETFIQIEKPHVRQIEKKHPMDIRPHSCGYVLYCVSVYVSSLKLYSVRLQIIWNSTANRQPHGIEMSSALYRVTWNSKKFRQCEPTAKQTNPNICSRRKTPDELRPNTINWHMRKSMPKPKPKLN